VVLLVAITVVLAASVAFVFLGGGDTQEPAPSAAISEQISQQSAEYTFESGDTFSATEANAVADVVIRDQSSGATETVSFDTSLDGGETKSVTVGGTSVTVEFQPSISGTEVQAGDSFQLKLSGASDVQITQVDTSVIWSSGDRSSLELYSDSSEPASVGGGSGGVSAPAASFATRQEAPMTGPGDAVRVWFTNVPSGTTIDPDDLQVEFEIEAENPATGNVETVTKSQPQSSWSSANDVEDWDPEFTSLHSGGSPRLTYGAVTTSDWSERPTTAPHHFQIAIRPNGGYDATIVDYRVTITHEPTGTEVYEEDTF
jgi:FlaG/FlaF family flagellin (archaellin)